MSNANRITLSPNEEIKFPRPNNYLFIRITKMIITEKAFLQSITSKTKFIYKCCTYILKNTMFQQNRKKDGVKFQYRNKNFEN